MTCLRLSARLWIIARKKTTVYLDEGLLTATKVLAVSMGRPEYEVVEDALRQYLR